MKEKLWGEYLMAVERMERKLLDDIATRKYVDGLIQRDEIKGQVVAERKVRSAMILNFGLKKENKFSPLNIFGVTSQ